LPGFASEFGGASPHHVVDNLMAVHGPLRDAAMHRRMVAYMETIPGFGTIAAMPWYPGQERQYQGLIRSAQAKGGAAFAAAARLMISGTLACIGIGKPECEAGNQNV
jgi:hypothetical protein